MQKGRCDVELDGDSVEDVMRLLHRICDDMDGAMGPQHHIHKESIRCVAFTFYPLSRQFVHTDAVFLGTSFCFLVVLPPMVSTSSVFYFVSL